MKKFNSLFCFLILFNLTAQTDSLSQKIQLKEVTLDASRIKSPKKTLPFAVSHKKFPQVQEAYQGASLQDYLNNVPGLFAQNTQNFAQDLRLSIRGFGAQSGFGIRGIKLMVDGIPETTPDGQGQLDNLALGLIQEITVLRGPASTFYGNASGGVIQIKTLTDFEKDFVRLRAQGGSYGATSFQATAGWKGQKTKAVIYQNRSQSDGYRDHSRYKQNVFNARVWHQFSTTSELSWQFNYTDSPYAYDAGGVNMESVNTDRKQPRAQNVQYNTFESVKHLKTGLQWEKSLGDNLTLNSYAFYAHRDFDGKLPFEFGGIVDLKRNYYGLGTALEYQIRPNHRMQFRASLADQKDQRNRYKNLKGARGDSTLSQEELFFNSALSVLDEFKWSFGLLRTGLRYDFQRLGTDSKINLNVVNPSIGFTFTDIGNHVLYTSFSTSFETPTLSELSANPTGQAGFNQDLSSSKATNFELGWRYFSGSNRLEASLFLINTQNEILSYELEAFPDRDFYRNAGKTQRKGIEIFWEHTHGAWQWNTSYTFATLLFDQRGSLKGNHLPGVPQHQFFGTLQYQLPSGLGIQYQARYTGSLYANDANTTKVDDYFLSNLRLWKKFGKLDFFSGVNNLLGKAYFDNIRINAFGKRFYEPAPLRNFYIGMNLSI